jgi:CelD/BcsL family acetyltransferase involved in cellulose biosynthesis
VIGDVAQGVRVEPVESIDAAVAEDWRTLAARGDNVFATFEWLATWWRHFGRRRELRVGVARDPDGAAFAILPVYVAARRPLRVARFLGHGPSDELGPVCAPDDRARAADALRRHLEAIPFDLAIADELHGSIDWGSALGAAPLARTASPVVQLAGSTWDDYLADRSANFREQVRRKTRRLAGLGRVTFRCTDDAARLDRDLDTFFALHSARWDGRSRGFARGRVAFHRDFAAQALTRGWLRLWFCEVAGRPVAVLYNLRFGNAESMYQAGRDPAFARASVGLVLQAYVLERAFADGLSEYRFLRGAEPYKSRFANADPGLESVAIARGAPARLARDALRPLPRAPRRVRLSVPAPYAWGTGAPPLWSRP